MLTVVQCWDDGVTTDVRVMDILRRHGAKATFNLNAGLHKPERVFGWKYKGTDVIRLGWDEMPEVYDGFTIANHSLSHPRLTELPAEEARREVVEGRERLQQHFGQPIEGFAYPFGNYNDAVKEIIREAGHVYARTVKNVEQPMSAQDPMALHPCCHFQTPDFWSRYEAARAGGVFYFWGHSHQIVTDAMWDAFERTIERISSDSAARWGTVVELFASRT